MSDFRRLTYGLRQPMKEWSKASMYPSWHSSSRAGCLACHACQSLRQHTSNAEGNRSYKVRGCDAIVSFRDVLLIPNEWYAHHREHEPLRWDLENASERFNTTPEALSEEPSYLDFYPDNTFRLTSFLQHLTMPHCNVHLERNVSYRRSAVPRNFVHVEHPRCRRRSS